MGTQIALRPPALPRSGPWRTYAPEPGSRNDPREVRMNTNKSMALAAMMLAGAIGCGNATDDTATEQGAALGDALGGTNATAFAEAKANFNLTETQQDGLGPIFNERSCSACHSNGTIGGAGQNVERRYGTLTNG